MEHKTTDINQHMDAVHSVHFHMLSLFHKQPTEGDPRL